MALRPGGGGAGRPASRAAQREGRAARRGDFTPAGHLYLNALDWGANDPAVPGQPVLVRYADGFVIRCVPGQGNALRERLERWLRPRGLKLNETQTRVTDSRRGFDFPGFRVRWQRSQFSARWYAHVEASPRSRQRLREAMRAKLNHWTLWQRIPEAMAGVNRLLKGWAGYFHFRHSSRVMKKANWDVCNRVRRWLWRKHRQTRNLWNAYSEELLYGRYGLWRLPERAAWKNSMRVNPNASR